MAKRKFLHMDMKIARGLSEINSPNRQPDFRSDLKKVHGFGSSHDGTGHWWQQRLTALALIPLTLWLMVSAFYLIGASYGVARAWVRQPITAIFLLLFIGFSLYHLKLGLQVIIEDYIHARIIKLISLIIMTAAIIIVFASCCFFVLKIAL